jgi:predicted ATP-grasp superfamily ATP-dependent carboligase
VNVLLTDGHTRAALAIVRSLGEAGHTVYVTAPRRRSIAGLSRHCAGEYLQPAGDASPDEIVGSLAATASRIEADRVVAMTDRTLTGIHAAAPIFAPGTLPPPSSDNYFAASDKTWLFTRCREWAIDVPDGVVIDGGKLPRRKDVEQLGGQWVLRPALSWRWDGQAWVRGAVRAIDDWDTLVEAIGADAAFAHPYLVQRRIRGTGCGLFLSAREGRIVALFSHQRVREKPPWGGVSTLCRSVRPPRDLVEIAERFVGEQDWSGLAMLEFKRDSADGRPYLLEINARPWGSMALSRAAGVDFARAWLTPETFVHEPGTYDEGVHLRWWWGDVDHHYLLRKELGETGWPAMLRGLISACAAGPRAAAWDTLRLDDPLPFAAETLSWLAGEG